MRAAPATTAAVRMGETTSAEIMNPALHPVLPRNLLISQICSPRQRANTTMHPTSGKSPRPMNQIRTAYSMSTTGINTNRAMRKITFSIGISSFHSSSSRFNHNCSPMVREFPFGNGQFNDCAVSMNGTASYSTANNSVNRSIT